MKRRVVLANIGEIAVRNTIPEIIKLCEAKGYEAERQKDHRMRDFYWQHAEHWKRSLECIK